MNTRTATSVMGAAIGIGVVILVSIPHPKPSPSCVQTKQEFEAVAAIANATGQLPDGERLPTGGTVGVNPELCKVSFDAPIASQREAREIQGNTNDIQVSVNSQQ